jgi:DNA repair exonuclease SbcCD ATPase subunit
MSREQLVTSSEATVRRLVILGTAGGVVLAGTIASFIFNSVLLAQVSALLAAFLLLPLALTATVRSYRGARHVLTGAAELDARREELEAKHEGIAARTAEIENRAARVEKQYQILCGLVNERSATGRPEELEDRDAEGTREALEEALEKLRQREASERLLADRIRELESARRRAEQELARLMSDSRERLRREREVSGTARERKLARATEDAEESLRVRSAAATEAEELLLEAQDRAQALLEEAEAEAAQLAAQGREEFESALRELKIREDEELEKGGQIIADARIRAAELVTRAEKQAEELVALGEAEFEALLQQISEHEQRERELYERIHRLEQEGSATLPAPPKPNLRSTRTSEVASQDPHSNGSPIAAESGQRREADGDHVVPDLVLLVDPPSGPFGGLRNLFGGFHSRDRSLDG